MSERGESFGEHPQLTAELIERQTGFSLVTIYPDFSRDGRITPSLHDDREEHARQHGEDNVLPSFFIDDGGVIQLGLFIRPTPDATV
jgi:hypothetical protein